MFKLLIRNDRSWEVSNNRRTLMAYYAGGDLRLRVTMNNVSSLNWVFTVEVFNVQNPGFREIYRERENFDKIEEQLIEKAILVLDGE